jgi:enoyl-CoA hydratase
LPNSERPHIDVRMEERPHGVIARLTINNARRLNALNSALMAEFVDVLGRLAADQKLRAVVLTGAGDKSFIVGADIGEMAAITNAESAKAFITRLHLCCDAIRKFPVPVIARIAGYCFGAGLEIAAACDLRIASETSSFGMQEVKLGIPSVIEAALLPTLVGWGRAREIMLLGEKFSAADALAWGLLERVAPAHRARCSGRRLYRKPFDFAPARRSAAEAPDAPVGRLAAFRRHRRRHRYIRRGLRER